MRPRLRVKHLQSQLTLQTSDGFNHSRTQLPSPDTNTVEPFNLNEVHHYKWTTHSCTTVNEYIEKGSIG